MRTFLVVMEYLGNSAKAIWDKPLVALGGSEEFFVTKNVFQKKSRKKIEDLGVVEAGKIFLRDFLGIFVEKPNF